MKIYGAALAREPRKPSPFCDCLNKAKIPFNRQTGQGGFCVLCRWYRQVCGAQSARKNGMECISQEKVFPCTGHIPQNPMAENKACPTLQGSQFCRRLSRKGGKGGKAELHGGIPPRVEDINRRLPVTGQGKMEFLLRICLCYVLGVTWVRRLV